MRLGIDIGIDAQDSDGALAHCHGKLRNRVAFILQLDIELADAVIERPAQLFARLAYTGEYHICGRDARGQRTCDFSA